MLAGLTPLLGAGALAKLGALDGPGTAVAAGEGQTGMHVGHGSASSPTEAAHDHGDAPLHPGFQAGGTVDHRGKRLPPDGAAARLRRGPYAPPRERPGLREWELVAQDREIEVAPGLKFPAWTYNGRIPGPRCAAGRASCCGSGSATARPIPTPSTSTASIRRRWTASRARASARSSRARPSPTSSTPRPSGCTCTTAMSPRWRSTSRAACTAPSSSTRSEGRPDADELVMVMNGFDTDFDLENEVYAVNTVGFAYMHEPIRVKRDQLVRIYLVNMLEYDPINSFHIHAQLLPLLPDRDLARAERVHRHGHAVPGPARHPRAALSLRGPVHVPRSPVRVRAAGLDGVLRGDGLMEARGASRRRAAGGVPAWVLGLRPAGPDRRGDRAVRGARRPGLGDRNGPPVEELAVERTVLRPGEIELTVRNDGPDPVRLAQVIGQRRLHRLHHRRPELGRLESGQGHDPLRLDRGRGLRRSTCSPRPAPRSITQIAAAVETPEADLGFYGLMALLGLLRGRHSDRARNAVAAVRAPHRPRAGCGVLMAVTVGLLGFLAVDATLEGIDVAGTGSQALAARRWSSSARPCPTWR